MTKFCNEGCGQQIASEHFFHKPINELDEKEMLTLHLMAKSPTRYNPILNPDNLRTALHKIIP